MFKNQYIMRHHKNDTKITASIIAYLSLFKNMAFCSSTFWHAVSNKIKFSQYILNNFMYYFPTHKKDFFKNKQHNSY